MRARLVTALVLLFLAAVPRAIAEDEKNEARNETRESLRATLDEMGKHAEVKMKFRQSTKEPYNFIATIDDGLKNAESLEVVIRVTASDTINFRVYPHYKKDKYININNAKDSNGLMRAMLLFTEDNFLYWGVDDEDDAFSGYTITLESGYPKEAVEIVLRSLRNTDGFVGQLRPFIDGTAPKTE